MPEPQKQMPMPKPAAPPEPVIECVGLFRIRPGEWQAVLVHARPDQIKSATTPNAFLIAREESKKMLVKLHEEAKP
jgi:hypothetical protein